MDYPVFSIKEIAEVKSKTKDLEKLFDEVVKCTPEIIQDLPYDLRTTDIGKLQERYDAITTLLEEKKQDLDDSFDDIEVTEGYIEYAVNSVSGFADNIESSLKEIEDNKFDISEYDLSMTPGQLEDIERELKKIDDNLPKAKELYNKLSPKLKAYLKDPSKDLGISDKDFENLEEYTSWVENGFSRLMRIWDFGEQGNNSIRSLYDDAQTLYSSSRTMRSGVQSIQENQIALQNAYKVNGELVNELNLLKQEQKRTEGKIKG